MGKEFWVEDQSSANSLLRVLDINRKGDSNSFRALLLDFGKATMAGFSKDAFAHLHKASSYYSGCTIQYYKITPTQTHSH